MILFDSHCHLNFPVFNQDRGKVLLDSRSAGITAICIPATKAAEWPVLSRIKNEQSVRQYVALGLHPCFISEHDLIHLEWLDEWLGKAISHVVAIGETGLDFYDNSLTEADRTFQLMLFTEQVRLAKQYQLPLIIHARKSHDQILQILRRTQPEAAGIIHAFSGSEQQAHQYIQLGFKLGFGGGITYSRARKTRRLAATLPLGSIVLETDAPDMPLNGFQGQRNSPERLAQIALCMAELRKQSPQQIAEVTTANCRELFDIKD